MVESTERLRGRAGVKQRLRRLKRTQGLCEHCLAKGIVRVATVVNHKTPLAHGGTDDDDNTENLCRDCDLIETAKQFGHKAKVTTGADGWQV
jgi:5-methylcytosine-specific restriction protein A